MIGEIHIRPMKLKDYDKISPLHAQLDRLHAESLPQLFQPAAELQRPRKSIAARLADSSRLWLVAECEQQLIGLVTAQAREMNHPFMRPFRYVHISTLVVDEAWRGRGVAQTLLERVYEWALEQEITQVDLNVYEFNERAIRFYAKVGFKTQKRSMWLELEDRDRDRGKREFQPAGFVRPDIADMEAYTPIVPFEILSERLGRAAEEIVKLDANENPYGPSPKALAAVRSGQYFHIYPDPEATKLSRAIGDHVNTDPERLLVGMGADELIDLVLRVVLSPRDLVVDCPPSFGMYPFSTYVNSGHYLAVPRRPDFSLDVAAIEAAVQRNPRIKVIFACSPNNPDGGVISDEDLRRLLALPALVVLDEAYVEFAAVDGHKSRISWIEDYQNLCVLRTFSKLAGLAGLRVGYGAFPAWLRPHLLKIKQPYNVNVAASLAAQGALEDGAWLAEKVQLLAAERERMRSELAKFDFLRPLPSHSNFVLCEVSGREAAALKRQLQDEYGVLVRHYSKPLLQNYIRISAGRPQDTDRLLEALAGIKDKG